MPARLTRLMDDPFFRHNLVFFVGSMVAAALNYLYHPILSRLMSVEAFGETQALFSIFIQGNVVLTVIGMILMNIFTNRAHKDEHRDLLATLYSLSFFLMLALAVVLALFSPLLAQSMQFRSPLPFLLVSAAFLLSVPLNFYRSFLQSEQKFSAISTLAILTALGRLLASALLVLLLSSTFGAMAGLLIAIFLGFLYVKKKTKLFIRLPHIQKIHISKDLRREGTYAALIFCGTMFVTLLYTADTLLVKYFFDPDIAGVYSGVATVARIILFATASIAGVLIAHIKISQTPFENHHVFMKAFALTLFVGGSFFILFALFPAVTLTVLLGARYGALAQLLLPLSFAICIVSFIQLFVSYFLALRTYTLIPITFGGFALLGILVTLFHESPEHIVYNFLTASVATLLAFTVLYVRQMWKWQEARYVETKK